MRVIILLALGLAAVAAAPKNPQRIVGGSVTTIERHPTAVALLYSRAGVNHRQACGGTILNNRSVLTAAHCVFGDGVSMWRVRCGSSNANSGGRVHNSVQFLNHPNYNTRTMDNDISVIRVSPTFAFGNTVRAASIAGSNYNLADNQQVIAVGWGATSFGGRPSEQLREVQIRTINQNTCRNRYAELGLTVTANMLCSGMLDVGGRDQCQGDSGGPLYHNNVVVGVCSWGHQCATARYPGVNARVSRYTSWIQSNA
ncbi:trypsin, alkaline C-like [Battus philenor]|uniref:trypsin, alkaline C-like n=1 Tax=Battus philenor TaxID=42288 RepID=UPI0035D01B7A